MAIGDELQQVHDVLGAALPRMRELRDLRKELSDIAARDAASAPASFIPPPAPPDGATTAAPAPASTAAVPAAGAAPGGDLNRQLRDRGGRVATVRWLAANCVLATQEIPNPANPAAMAGLTKDLITVPAWDCRVRYGLDPNGEDGLFAFDIPAGNLVSNRSRGDGGGATGGTFTPRPPPPRVLPPAGFAVDDAGRVRTVHVGVGSSVAPQGDDVPRRDVVAATDRVAVAVGKLADAINQKPTGLNLRQQRIG